ncbi:retrovirus-related pol polyprotein from transposon TNT 1-94 [Tanacetum coccineum]
MGSLKRKESSDEELEDFRLVKTKSTPWQCGDPNYLIGECPTPPKDRTKEFCRRLLERSRCGEKMIEEVQDDEVSWSPHDQVRLFNSVNKNDHGREFDNEVQFGEFCNANGITHNFSAPRTPQSNGVVERKNRTLQEMSRTMLNEQSLPQKFWCNAVDTSTYILNRILIRAILGKTPYELLRD